MSEYEIRRLERTIEQLENAARQFRNPTRLRLPSDAVEGQFLASEIADARKKLRELLAAE